MYEDNDFLVEQNEFNVGIIHEVGHNTERDPKRYSTRNDFRDLFGWNHADHHLGTRKDRKLVDEIATCCGKDSFVPGISSEYEKIGKEIIFSLLNDHYNNLFMTGLNRSRRLHVIKIAMQSFKSRLNVDDIEFDKLSKMYSQSKIFIAACAGVETNDPWKLEKENIPCPEKQIHEGYKNQEWYFYKGSARKQKYSNYAFRTSQ